MKRTLLSLSAIFVSFCTYAQNTYPWPSSGNIGIGTTTPESALHLYEAEGSKTGGTVMPTKSILKLSRAGTLNYSYNESAEFRLGHGGPSVWGSKLDLFLNGGSNQSNIPDQHLMSWLYNGNVGIGTATPSVRLDVQSDTYTANFQNNAASNSPVVSILQPNAGGNDVAQGLYIDTRSTGSALDIVNSSTPLFRVKSNGKVGIGTTNPSASLDVAGHIQISSQSGSTPPSDISYGLFPYGGVGLGIFSGAYGSSQGIGIWTNPGGTKTEVMRILSGGNVGIGTTSPDAKLTVNGVIHSKEVKVDNSVPVPDYVFEADYKLKSLEEIKTYVDKNHHLPEIPSAKEIEKNGIQVGDMSLKLLKTIEELTLYVIELNNQVKAQKEEINNLKKELHK